MEARLKELTGDTEKKEIEPKRDIPDQQFNEK